MMASQNSHSMLSNAGNACSTARQLLTKPTVLIVLIGLLFPGLSQAAVGKFLFVLGDVQVENTASRAAKKGDSVVTGDEVVTGQTGRAQLLMVDKAKIALRPETRFVVEAYELPSSSETGAAIDIETQGGTSVLRLLEGGFRTISGSVGKEEADEYQVKTPVATIGIRGTDYSAVLTPGAKPRLFVGVTAGEIVLVNQVDKLVVYAGEYVVTDAIDQPFRLLKQPPLLLDETVDRPITRRDEPKPEGSRQTQRDNNLNQQQPSNRQLPTRASFSPTNQRRVPPPEQQGNPGPDDQELQPDGDEPEVPVTTDGGDLTGGGEPRAVAPVAFSLPNAEPLVAQSAVSKRPTMRDASGNLSQFSALVGRADGSAENLVFNIGTATNQNVGIAQTENLRWGRWSDGVISVSGNSGENDLPLAESSLHWVTTNGPTTSLATNITGTASYALVGNTDPTDAAGNVGVLGAADLLVDFNNATVDSNLDISIAQQVWQARGQGQLVDGGFVGAYDTSISGQDGSGAGVFAGFFTAPDGAGLPNGAGMTYTLNSPDGEQTLNGAAAFGNPQ